MRNHDEHEKAAKRHLGYSCEEIGGLAYSAEDMFPKLERITTNRAIFISPYRTNQMQPQADLSHSLVMNFLPREEAEHILI